MITLVAALYVIAPAVLALGAVLYASFCPVRIEDKEHSVMVDIYLQLGAIVQRKATIAAQSADYWERTMQIAVTPEARVRARAYAKMWREEWLKLHNRTCAYVQRSVE